MNADCPHTLCILTNPLSLLTGLQSFKCASPLQNSSSTTIEPTIIPRTVLMARVRSNATASSISRTKDVSGRDSGNSKAVWANIPEYDEMDKVDPRGDLNKTHKVHSSGKDNPILKEVSIVSVIPLTEASKFVKDSPLKESTVSSNSKSKKVPVLIPNSAPTLTQYHWSNS